MDALKINGITIPDIEKAERVRKLLQRFNSVQYINNYK
jgi:hypothetical protein